MSVDKSQTLIPFRAGHNPLLYTMRCRHPFRYPTPQLEFRVGFKCTRYRLVLRISQAQNVKRLASMATENHDGQFIDSEED